MTNRLDPLRVVAIVDQTTKVPVFGVHIHSPFDALDADQVSTDAIVRQYIQEFCSDCSVRDNRLASTTLRNEFAGVVATVSERADGPKTYSIEVRRVPTSSDDYWWWMNKLHSDGGWADRLEQARTGINPQSTPQHVPDPFWSSLWSSYGNTFLLVTFAVLLTGIIHSFLGSSDDDGA